MSHPTVPLAVFRYVSQRLLGSSSSDWVRASPRRRLTQAWLVEPLEHRIVPATIQVTSLADAGAGTLRAAIEQANLDAAHDTITFAPSITGTITLSTALPDLSAGMIIIGPGPSALTVARSGANDTWIFVVDAGAKVNISGLTITGNNVTYGVFGGVQNSGTLTVVNSIITNNTTLFLGSRVSFDGSGGGIDNLGTLTVINSAITQNTAGQSGGGIDNSGTMTITNSTLSGNKAGSGAGINNSGTLTVTNSTFSGNTGASGGGINNSGTLTVTNSTLSGNTAGNGGGIDNSGTLTVTDSTLSGNTAGFGGGYGSGGGMSNSGTVTVFNSTLAANVAGSSGGGIWNDGHGTLTIFDSTLAGNSAGTGGGGGIEISGGTIALTGTIVATNEVSGTPQDIQGAVSTASHNLVGVNSGLSGIKNGVNGNLLGTSNSLIDPRLGPLQDNGGPTWTMALLPGSPAINAGVAVPDVTTDQRGVYRPQGRAPDIGAFELQLPPEVLEVQRHGVHDQPTTLVVIFSHPMDAASAEDLSDYRLVSAGPDHRFGTRDDRAIRISSMQYDAASHTVTIVPAYRLPLRRRFQLTLLGTPPTGLKDAAGLFLDGAGTGLEGSNYVIVINDKLLVPPIIHKAGKHAAADHRMGIDHGSSLSKRFIRP